MWCKTTRFLKEKRKPVIWSFNERKQKNGRKFYFVNGFFVFHLIEFNTKHTHLCINNRHFWNRKKQFSFFFFKRFALKKMRKKPRHSHEVKISAVMKVPTKTTKNSLVGINFHFSFFFAENINAKMTSLGESPPPKKTHENNSRTTIVRHS